MATHLEFVVPGPPISNQQSSDQGRANLEAWRAVINGISNPLWGPRQMLTGDLKAIIINFFAGNRPSVDLDNMSKPILDEMQMLVYENDRQIRQAHLSHVNITAPFSIAGASAALVQAIQQGSQFVYVRIEDPDQPLPLPR